MSTINEQIVTGRANRVLIDKATKLWQRISVWTKASDVEFNDGKTAQAKVGAIKGITTDLNTTETGYAADMTALVQLNSDLGGFKPVIDETGKITGYKTTVGGADTVFPFNDIDRLELIYALANSGLGLTEDSTPEQIYAALATKFPPTKSWIVPGWSVSPSGYATMSSNNSYVQMIMGNVAGTVRGTSPIIDITPFETLTLYGESKRYSRNGGSSYFPTIYLVNKNTGDKTFLFENALGAAAGTGAPGAKAINLTYNTANLSGDYYLEFEIYSYETGTINSSGNPNGGNNGSSNYGSYIKLTKALLSA